jgi:hypothetical protein
MSQGGFKYHEQVINVLGMLEVKWRDKIASEMRGEDGEPPGSQASRLSQLA